MTLSFPIAYRMDRIELTVNRTVEDRPRYDNFGQEVSSRSETSFSFHPVEFTTPLYVGDTPVEVEGRLRFDISYGRINMLKFRIRREIALRYTVVDHGDNVTAGFYWRDIGPDFGETTVERDKVFTTAGIGQSARQTAD